YGTSENAIKTQIWIAISIYVLVAIVKKELKLDQSLYTILQVLSVTLFEKEPNLQVLTNNDYSNPSTVPSNHLNLFE
ncbi:MAG: IS4 family transposase, partial [Candidatus Theseobacter exili]|nr:IS4 family transposase [Candidatus Theseobacter exili]